MRIIPFLIELKQILQKLASHRTNRTIVQWVSGNTVIPTGRRVSRWNPRCVTYSVIIYSMQERTNNAFQVSTTD